MQRLEVSGAVRPLYGSLGVKGSKMMDKLETILTQRLIAQDTDWCQQAIWKIVPRHDKIGQLWEKVEDDMVILATQEDLTIASLNLQEHSHIIGKWLKKRKIKFNESKSSHITFTVRKGHCPAGNINQTIKPQTEAVQYLGLHFSCRLNWNVLCVTYRYTYVCMYVFFFYYIYGHAPLHYT